MRAAGFILGAIVLFPLSAKAQTLEELRKSLPPSLALLEDLTAEEKKLLAPTPVTLHLKDRPRVEVIREAAKQAKLAVIGPRPDNLATTQISPITRRSGSAAALVGVVAGDRRGGRAVPWGG